VVQRPHADQAVGVAGHKDRTGSPTLGEHTEEILKEVLGLSEAERSRPKIGGRVFRCP